MYDIYHTLASDMVETTEIMLIKSLDAEAANYDPKYLYLKLPTVYTMEYNRSMEELDVLMKLQKAEQYVLKFITEVHISSKKRFIFNSTFRKDFAAWRGGNGLHDVTFTKAMTKLSQIEYIIRVGKGEYWVNPKYYYRGDPKYRTEFIKVVYDERAAYNEKMKLIKEKNNENPIEGIE